ncbi:MAG: SRPBCC family protein, partial [Miltoncostaeaceae bacterium]
MSLVVTVVAPTAPATAWSLWSDVGSWPVWNPECVSATLDGPAGEGTVLDLTLRHPRGREFITRPRVSATVPGREFGWETRGLGFRA